MPVHKPYSEGLPQMRNTTNVVLSYDAFVWASSEKHMSRLQLLLCMFVEGWDPWSIAVQRKQGETNKGNSWKLDVLCSWCFCLLNAICFLDKERMIECSGFQCLDAVNVNVYISLFSVTRGNALTPQVLAKILRVKRQRSLCSMFLGISEESSHCSHGNVRAVSSWELKTCWSKRGED